MDVYQTSILCRSVSIPIHQMGGDVDAVIASYLQELEGQCVEDGYMKKGSIVILRKSCGVLNKSNVVIQVAFECKLANPVAGQIINCVVENNTKAGIKARLDAHENPFVVFLARDHHHTHPTFSDIKEKDKIKVSIMGQRYDIFDKQISVIGLLESFVVAEPKVEVAVTPKETKPDKFVLSSKSSNVKPGKASQESVNDKTEYEELSKINEWRKQLSNSDESKFTWSGEGLLDTPFPEGTQWNTIEHAYQASRFKVHNEDKLASELILGNKYGNGDGNEALTRRSSKTVSDTPEWESIADDVLEDIARAKFSENPERARTLKATKQAELWHTGNKGKKSELVRYQHLEDLRDVL